MKVSNFSLKFGLKQLIDYNEIDNNIEAREFFSQILYCGLTNLNPQLTLNDAIQLWDDAPNKEELKEWLINQRISNQQINELLSRAVGEIGLSIFDAYWMSPDEIDVVYEGYLRKKETEANLTILAIKKALTNDNSVIRLVEKKECIEGNMNERNETLRILGIEDC